MSREDVDEMKRVVNAVVDAYLQEVVDAERADQLRRRDRLQISRSKRAETAWKKAMEVDAMELHLRGQGSDTADTKGNAHEIVETPELRMARRELAELTRFTARLREELDEIDVNMTAPARVSLLQRASE